jgi:hypothetical protein
VAPWLPRGVPVGTSVRRQPLARAQRTHGDRCGADDPGGPFGRHEECI